MSKEKLFSNKVPQSFSLISIEIQKLKGGDSVKNVSAAKPRGFSHLESFFGISKHQSSSPLDHSLMR